MLLYWKIFERNTSSNKISTVIDSLVFNIVYELNFVGLEKIKISRHYFVAGLIGSILAKFQWKRLKLQWKQT